MIPRVLRFIRLPMVLMLIFTIGRFWLGAAGKVPYAPRGSSIFSIVVLTFISYIYFGAISGKVGRFNWGGTVLIAVFLATWAQILIFAATYLSYAMGIETSYFRHWDALNLPEGTMA